MNNKARETRAMLAMGSLFIAMFLGADAWANRLTSDYYHEQAVLTILSFVGFAVLMFAWNAVQYAVMLRRNKR
jgi:hypothetical protein